MIRDRHVVLEVHRLLKLAWQINHKARISQKEATFVTPSKNTLSLYARNLKSGPYKIKFAYFVRTRVGAGIEFVKQCPRPEYLIRAFQNRAILYLMVSRPF